MQIKNKKYLLLIITLLLCIGFFSLSNTAIPGSLKALQQNKDSLSNNKIIIIGDTQHKSFLEYFIFHENNAKETKFLLNKIAGEDPSILVHLGDVTAYGSSDNQWENFEEDSKPITDKNIPIYPVFGNHDYYGDNDECYNNFYKHFPHIEGYKWYSFVHLKIGFIMLNSNYDNLSKSEIIAQKKWYINLINSMNANDEIKFIIVCSHHPPYTNSKVVSPAEDVSNNYAIPFQLCKKGAIFFSGHCHSYEKFSIGGKYFIVSGGGGGSRQRLNTDISLREYDDLFEGTEIRFFHFCEIEIATDTLNFRVIKLNEDNSFSVADEVTIIKQK